MEEQPSGDSPLPSYGVAGKLDIVSTVQEIEEAIKRLPDAQRDVLEARLLARRCGLSALDETEQAELLASLDEAERDIDAGRSYTADEVRERLHGWLGK